MSRPKLSPLQRNVLHAIERDGPLDHATLTEFERKPYDALRRKGYLRLHCDAVGALTWTLNK